MGTVTATTLAVDPAGLPPHRPSLKVGSLIILLWKLDLPKLYNGTRPYVKKMRAM
jgi:hypothetical protein